MKTSPEIIMKRMMKYHLLTLCLVLGSFLSGQTSFAQCDMKFDYSVENASASQSDGSLTIVFENAISPLTCLLFDSSLGIPELLMEAKQRKDATGRKITFFDLPPATYMVRVGQKNCKTIIIGEKTGIVIGVKNGK